MSVNFQDQLELLSRYHFGRQFFPIHKALLSHPDFGMVPALIYAALLDRFDQLTYGHNDNDAAYRWLEKNDGWFYISQTQIAQVIGCDVKTVRRNISKIIGKLIVEKKMMIDNCERSVYNFIEWDIDGGGTECPRGIPQGGGGEGQNVLGGRDRMSPHTRVLNNKHNNTYNIYDELEGSETKTQLPKSKRVHRPKQSNPNSTHSKFIELASKWEPKLSKSPITEKQISRAANVLQKLVEEFGFSFKELELGIEWAYNDTVPQKSGFCWRKYFKTLTGLDKRNTGSATNTEDIKFQKIHDARLRSAQSDPDAIYLERVEAIIRKFWDAPEDEDDVQRCLDDLEWFQRKLDTINKQRLSKHKFTWHDGEAFMKVVEFLIDIEANSKKTFKFVMNAYLEFLQYKLQDGTVHTLYPGYFTRTSEIFRQYLAEDYNVTGRMLLDWQKGDFDE